MPYDWRSATPLQARSDYRLLVLLLGDSDVPICHVLHYLQMTTEKLAKAYLTPPGGRYPNTHNAFAEFVRRAKGRREFQAACGFKNNASQYYAYLDSLRAVAKAVEDLSPDGGDHPNPEYPWASDGVIYVPVEYLFNDLSLRSPGMIKLFRFIECCFSLS